DFHSLRHTHSTELHSAGAPLLDIKERLGHCKIEMTMHYTHDSDKLRKQTTEIIETMYDNKINNGDS
ncbi:MAG: tyrosine-type recombinase/integrase, partial [Clostridia bacterium]|nr:tyrosine-type recombinase/integrase [Clostridia bacterium]